MDLLKCSLDAPKSGPARSVKLFDGESRMQAAVDLSPLNSQSFAGLLMEQCWGQVSTDQLSDGVGAFDMEIYVRTPRGATIRVPVQFNMAVSTVKNTICLKMGIAFNEQAMQLDDAEKTVLDDHRFLVNYEITEGSTLFLVPRGKTNQSGLLDLPRLS